MGGSIVSQVYIYKLHHMICETLKLKLSSDYIDYIQRFVPTIVHVLIVQYNVHIQQLCIRKCNYMHVHIELHV